ncbi:MAG: DUF460 domain-containing protein [Thermocladium sp.]
MADSLVMGIDINGGEFAYVVASDKGLIESGTADEWGLYRVMRKYRIKRLAIDNVRELLEMAPHLIRKMAALPFDVSIIQVTRLSDGSEKSMEHLVKEHLGINVSKLSPLQTAEAAARLLIMGVGTAIKLYEDETHIIVKAKISTTPGGQSRNRYERNVSLRIKSLTEVIKEALDKGGLDYDLFYREREGIRSSVFVVYAEKSVVRRIVKPYKGLDVEVRIESALLDSFRFEGATVPSHDRKLIIGVDPGIVAGVAIMDLRGNILRLYSGRNLSRSALLRMVYRYGSPIIIATDVSKPSEYVKKLAAMVNSILYYPENDLSIDEKTDIATNLARQHGIKVSTPHQRDALAAAYKAYMSVKPKLDKVEDEVKRRAIGLSLDHVKELVIKGIPINQALNEALKKEQTNNNVKVIVIKDKQEDKVDNHLEYIEALEKEVERLRRENKELKEELERAIIRSPSGDSTLRTRITYLEQDLAAEISKNMDLTNKLRQLEEHVINIATGSIGIAIKAQNEDEVIDAFRRGFYPMTTLYHLSMMNISRLLDLGANTIIISEDASIGGLKTFFKLGINPIPLKDVLVWDIGDVKLISRDAVIKALNNMRSNLEGEVNHDFMEDIINEYRRRRL